MDTRKVEIGKYTLTVEGDSFCVCLSDQLIVKGRKVGDRLRYDVIADSGPSEAQILRAMCSASEVQEEEAESEHDSSEEEDF